MNASRGFTFFLTYSDLIVRDLKVRQRASDVLDLSVQSKTNVVLSRKGAHNLLVHQFAVHRGRDVVPKDVRDVLKGFVVGRDWDVVTHYGCDRIGSV